MTDKHFDFTAFVPSVLAGAVGALALNVVLVAIAIGVASSDSARDVVEAFVRDIAGEQQLVVDSTGEASDVVNVVDQANPAVVSIVITKDVPVLEQYFEEYNPFGNGVFGFQMPQYRQKGTEKQEIGGGSGFLVTEDGYVVTNAHVVSDTEADYTVFLNDETEFEAEVVATDTLLDIAVLKIDGDDFPYLEFGDSDALQVGQTVVAIGNALGEFRNTVSVGVVSGLSRDLTASSGSGESERLIDVIQTDAAVNPGNSGGPLLDLSGKVIGVNVATSLNGENISFALPATEVKKAVDSIRENGRVVRAYLGVRYVLIDEDMKKANALEVDYGALILRSQNGKELGVVPGSPADKAGLEENDIILEVDGERIDAENPLNIAMNKKSAGDKVTLKVLHDGEEIEVEVTLGEMPQAED